MASQNFALLLFFLFFDVHLSMSKTQAVGVAPHDAAVDRCGNVGSVSPREYLAIKNSNFAAIFTQTGHSKMLSIAK